MVARRPLASNCPVVSAGGPRLGPKMVTISPGATTNPVLSNCGLPRKLAAFSTLKGRGVPKIAVDVVLIVHDDRLLERGAGQIAQPVA